MAEVGKAVAGGKADGRRRRVVARILAMTATQPPPVDKLIALAARFAEIGRRDEARVLLELAERSHPPHPAIGQLLGLLDLQRGDVSAARSRAAASLALRPDHLPTLRLLADASRGSGESEAAASALDRIVALAPDDIEAATTLALLRHDLRQFEAAATAWRSVLRLAPERSDAEVNLGIVLQEAGHLDEALQAYGRAWCRHPETFGRIAHALAVPGVGRVWVRLEDLRRALGSSVVRR